MGEPAIDIPAIVAEMLAKRARELQAAGASGVRVRGVTGAAPPRQAPQAPARPSQPAAPPPAPPPLHEGRGPSVEQAHIQARLLHGFTNSPGLLAGFVFAEALAPPLALRPPRTTL